MTKRIRIRLKAGDVAAAQDAAAAADAARIALLQHEVAELAEMVARLGAKLDAAMEQVAAILTARINAPEPVPPAPAAKMNGRRPPLVPPPRPRRDLFDIGQDD